MGSSWSLVCGTGALKVGADYIKRLNPAATIYISDPSWENHRALFESAGFPVENAYDGRDAMVALLVDGQPLPAERGFPARLVVPGLASLRRRQST